MKLEEALALQSSSGFGVTSAADTCALIRAAFYNWLGLFIPRGGKVSELNRPDSSDRMCTVRERPRWGGVGPWLWPDIAILLTTSLPRCLTIVHPVVGPTLQIWGYRDGRCTRRELSPTK